MKLYELTAQYQQALDFLTDPDNGIDQQTISDTLEGLSGEVEEKLLNIARFISSLEETQAAMETIAARQKQRIENIAKKSGWLRNYLIDNMQKIGKVKAEANDISISLALNPQSVKVVDESLIPFDFFENKTTTVLSKTKIKQAGGCPGVVIEHGYRAVIK